MTWLIVMEYLCHKWSQICSTCRNTSRSFPHSWLITRFVTRLTRRVSLVEQELPTLPEHLSSLRFWWNSYYSIFSFIHVCFVDRFLSFCIFCFWPLCCLFFFDVWILITPLVSSSYSYTTWYMLCLAISVLNVICIFIVKRTSYSLIALIFVTNYAAR
jgi:hypothetical protein